MYIVWAKINSYFAVGIFWSIRWNQFITFCINQEIYIWITKTYGKICKLLDKKRSNFILCNHVIDSSLWYFPFEEHKTSPSLWRAQLFSELCEWFQTTISMWIIWCSRHISFTALRFLPFYSVWTVWSRPIKKRNTVCKTR